LQPSVRGLNPLLVLCRVTIPNECPVVWRFAATAGFKAFPTQPISNGSIWFHLPLLSIPVLTCLKLNFGSIHQLCRRSITLDPYAKVNPSQFHFHINIFLQVPVHLLRIIFVNFAQHNGGSLMEWDRVCGVVWWDVGLKRKCEERPDCENKLIGWCTPAVPVGKRLGYDHFRVWWWWPNPRTKWIMIIWPRHGQTEKQRMNDIINRRKNTMTLRKKTNVTSKPSTVSYKYQTSSIKHNKMPHVTTVTFTHIISLVSTYFQTYIMITIIVAGTIRIWVKVSISWGLWIPSCFRRTTSKKRIFYSSVYLSMFTELFRSPCYFFSSSSEINFTL